MLRFLIRLVVNAVAIWAAVQLVPGLIYEGSTASLLLVALVFGVVNALVRPLLLLLTCPFIILTLGLFVLVINTIMLSLTVWLSGIFDLGLTSTGFWATFLGAIVISIVSSIINLLIKDDNEDDRGNGVVIINQ
ncbi:phage holin family protein [Candidatus Leptofilum sp.]|uniref:phage holin family protein n=1 Tax=Candidatus Leptofilum sp. TaxID=3241576 RepID=UPI003B5983E8